MLKPRTLLDLIENPVPPDVSPVCIWGEHDYCADVTNTKRRAVAMSGEPFTFIETVYCDCDCHMENNGIYIPAVDDEPATMVVE